MRSRKRKQDSGPCSQCLRIHDNVDAVGARFEQHFAAHGIEAWREPHDVFGDAVHALVTKPGSNEKPVLLMGHRDTVFSKGEVARRPFTIDGTRAYGPGVADTELPRLFTAFARASGDGRGPGLGLALCRRIVERHGGMIWAERGADGGLAVCFELPEG